MKVLIIPLTILIGILIIAGIILNTSSPISLPNSSKTKNDTNSAKGAILKSIDGGRTFEPKSRLAPNSGLNLSQNVIQLINAADKDILAVNTKGGIFKTNNWGEEWSVLLDLKSNPTATGVNPNNTNEIYIGAISSKRARLYRTTSLEKDAKWQEIYTEPKSGTFFVSVKVDPKNDNIVYALLSSGVLLKSYNKGLDWVMATNLKTSVIELAIDTNSPNTVFIAGSTKIFISQDGGFTFEESTPKLKLVAVTGAQITSFAVNPNNSREIYIGSTGELIRTQNMGETWENVRILTPNLSLPINNIKISPSDTRTLYYNVGTVLYTSSNAGESWNTVDLSSTIKNISDILIDKEKSDIIYISTN